MPFGITGLSFTVNSKDAKGVNPPEARGREAYCTGSLTTMLGSYGGSCTDPLLVTQAACIAKRDARGAACTWETADQSDAEPVVEEQPPTQGIRKKLYDWKQKFLKSSIGKMVKGVSYAYDTTSIQTDDKCTLKYMKENAESDEGSYSFNWCQPCRLERKPWYEYGHPYEGFPQAATEGHAYEFGKDELFMEEATGLMYPVVGEGIKVAMEFDGTWKGGLYPADRSCNCAGFLGDDAGDDNTGPNRVDGEGDDATDSLYKEFCTFCEEDGYEHRICPTSKGGTYPRWINADPTGTPLS